MDFNKIILLALCWSSLAILGMVVIFFMTNQDIDESWTNRNTDRLRQRWKDAITKANEERP